MGLFGKNKVDPVVAVASFYRDMMQDPKAKWPQAKEQLSLTIPNSLAKNPELLDDHWTVFFVALARVAEEMQALRNLLPAAEAERLRNLTFSFLLANPDFGEDASGFVREVDRRWQRALDQMVNPTDAVGSSLYEVLELDETVDMDGQRFLSPVAMLGLGSLPTLMGIGWWKRFLAKNQIAGG